MRYDGRCVGLSVRKSHDRFCRNDQLWRTIAVRKLLVIAILICAAQFAHAATTPNSVVTAQTPNRGVVQFLQGTDSAGTYKTLYTAGANGSKCNAMWSTNNDA